MDESWIYNGYTRLDIHIYWLVVGPPLWKIWVRQLGWLATQYFWEHKKLMVQTCPNHQPVYKNTGKCSMNFWGFADGVLPKTPQSWGVDHQRGERKPWQAMVFWRDIFTWEIQHFMIFYDILPMNFSWCCCISSFLVWRSMDQWRILSNCPPN